MIKLSQAAQDRLLSFSLGLPAWMVLAIARSLEPDVRGFGTHQQLGLGTCTILGLTGWPCPMCGMTTTFTHMAHLSPIDAVLTQPFGVVLFLITAAVGLVGLVELLFPTGRWRTLYDRVLQRELWVAGLLLLGLAGGWVYKLAVMRIGPFGP